MGTSELPVAKLPRKRDRLRSNSVIRQEINKRWIESIKEVESRPVKCISVDSPTKLYLAGKNYIPTHNSSGVIYPGVGWIIKNNPGNTFITVGAPDLIEKSMEKLDLMIDACGIRDYIKPQVMRNRMNKSGDTNFKKEFPGGSMDSSMTLRALKARVRNQVIPVSCWSSVLRLMQIRTRYFTSAHPS
jgi:hypothetical protein